MVNAFDRSKETLRGGGDVHIYIIMYKCNILVRYRHIKKKLKRILNTSMCI